MLARAARTIERVDRASIAKTGLSVTDFSILEALLQKGPLPVNTIGKKVLLTSGSMTAAVNRLEKKGPGPADSEPFGRPLLPCASYRSGTGDLRSRL